MKRHDQETHARHTVIRRELHAYATQRANPRRGSGVASVDIHAWLLTFAMAFLLRDDPYGSLPLQRAEWPGPIVHASTDRG